MVMRVFNWINDFFKSGLSRNQILAEIVLLALAIAITAWVTHLLHKKVFQKQKVNKISSLKEEVERLRKEIQKYQEMEQKYSNLKAEVSKRDDLSMLSNPAEIRDKALDDFTKED